MGSKFWQFDKFLLCRECLMWVSSWRRQFKVIDNGVFTFPCLQSVKQNHEYTLKTCIKRVCYFIDICFRILKANPFLKMTGHQITTGKICFLTSLLIHHLNQRTTRSRWVIDLRSKESKFCHNFFYWVLFNWPRLSLFNVFHVIYCKSWNFHWPRVQFCFSVHPE